MNEDFMHLRIAIPILLLFATTLSGCVAPPKSSYVGEKRLEEFSAPLGQRLTAETGDALFVEGEFYEYPAYRLLAPIDSLMPGSMSIPFSFEIQPSLMSARYSRGSRDFFCAPSDKVAASFPGLGSVIHSEDCVGIAIDRQTGKFEWIVDNSIYNRGATTVWDRDVSKAEMSLIGEKTYFPALDRAASFVEFIFQGHYSGLLHFLLREGKAGRIEETEFKFDYPSGENIYGIRGKVFKVIAVDNVRLQYEWVRIS